MPKHLLEVRRDYFDIRNFADILVVHLPLGWYAHCRVCGWRRRASNQRHGMELATAHCAQREDGLGFS